MNTIQASEFRIGNLVWLNDGNFNRYEDFIEAIELGRVSTRNCKTIYCPIENIEHIPLNEDWLVRFGFESRQSETTTYLSKRYGHCSFATDSSIDCSEVYLESPNGAMMGSAKYVHQLQNLYFALTGTELTLTDK